MKIISIVYYSLISLYSMGILLLTFVIPHGGEVIDNPNIDDIIDDIIIDDNLHYPNELSPILKDAEVLGFYQNDFQLITIYKFRIYESNVFVADIVVRNPKMIMSALAFNIFGGSNYVQTVREMAENHDAVFAINADYANHYPSGIVIKNGEILRTSQSYRDLITLFEDGTVASFKEESIEASTLKSLGAWQTFSFGPVLIKNSISVASVNDGLQRSLVDNPRSGFGWVSDFHYRFVTVDGRTDISRGVDIEEFAQIFQYLEAKEAYNFDGGGSATMYFKGDVINIPSNGSERAVGDCVYLTY
jgi:exopolysaccharide biosynthesis protein